MSFFLGGLQAQLSGAAHTLLGDGHNVLFDFVTSPSNENIAYDQATGEFLLRANKNYYVSWWVAVDGTESVPTVDIAVALDHHPLAVSSSPLVTGHLSGSALISVTAAPQSLSILNITGNPIRYAATLVQATIVIIELAV